MLVSQSKNSPKLKEMIFWPEYDPDFVPKKFITFSENKYGQNQMTKLSLRKFYCTFSQHLIHDVTVNIFVCVIYERSILFMEIVQDSWDARCSWEMWTQAMNKFRHLNFGIFSPGSHDLIAKDDFIGIWLTKAMNEFKHLKLEYLYLSTRTLKVKD